MTEALSNWDVMACGKGSIPANSTNSRFSLPRRERAASRLFSFLNSKILGLGRLLRQILVYLFFKMFLSIHICFGFFVAGAFVKERLITLSN